MHCGSHWGFLSPQHLTVVYIQAVIPSANCIASIPCIARGMPESITSVTYVSNAPCDIFTLRTCLMATLKLKPPQLIESMQGTQKSTWASFTITSLQPAQNGRPVEVKTSVYWRQRWGVIRILRIAMLDSMRAGFNEMIQNALAASKARRQAYRWWISTPTLHESALTTPCLIPWYLYGDSEPVLGIKLRCRTSFTGIQSVIGGTIELLHE